ncbi:hypothetical protein Ocin01_08076 [Orchesella cincta]|uniref:Uncharacterized protein n=1 Tax=Orchesella cincta TaxID=48709 RepID=A0A1D2N0K9_ORCCI|nr:hypothetical protein Ocin01_08076 [Orchesella cincta]
MKVVMSVVAIAIGLIGCAAAGTKQHADVSDPSGNWGAARQGGGGYGGGWGWGYDVSTGLVFVGLPLLLLIPLLFCLPYLLHGHGHHGGHHGGGGAGGGGYGHAGGYGRFRGGSAAAATIQRRTDQLTQQILPKL